MSDKLKVATIVERKLPLSYCCIGMENAMIRCWATVGVEQADGTIQDTEFDIEFETSLDKHTGNPSIDIDQAMYDSRYGESEDEREALVKAIKGFAHNPKNQTKLCREVEQRDINTSGQVGDILAASIIESIHKQNESFLRTNF